MKKILVGLVVCMLSAVTVFANSLQYSNTDADTAKIMKVFEYQKKETDWSADSGPEIKVCGVGLPGQFKGVKGSVRARRAAMLDAYRLIREQMRIEVKASSISGNNEMQDDFVQVRAEGVIMGAKIVKEEMKGGVYLVTMSVPMYGNNSLGSIYLSELKKDSVVAKAPLVVTPNSTVLTKEKYIETVEEINQGGFTGVVVDASNIGLECTMAPQILDTNNRVIYGKDNIDMSFAVSYGLVQYSKDISSVKSGNSRAGARPLYVQAVGVKGGTNSVNPVNVIVTPEDADKILLLAGNSPSIMKKGLIVFIR